MFSNSQPILRRFPGARVRARVNAHVIHLHPLRERRRGVRISRQISTDRYVEQQELIMVEDPRFPGRQVRRRDGEIDLIVQKPPDARRLPLNTEEMEAVGESYAV